MKRLVKKLIPKTIINLFHYFFAWYGSVWYNHPSENLLVIGVTGTSGKSSTVYFLRQILEKMGYKVGALSTIDFYTGSKEQLNDQKMTMLGRGQNHKYLREMVNNDCDIAIIETTSEGALQHRHRFINYDHIVFTTLYPEHIESHGSFENYKQTKLDILEYVSKCKNKYLYQDSGFEVSTRKKRGQNCQKIPKTCFVSGNNKHTVESLEFDFDKKYIFSRFDQDTFYNDLDDKTKEIVSKDNEMNKEGLNFSIERNQFHANMYGEHNIMNLLACISVARSLNASWKKLQQIIQEVNPPPGRVEFIKEAEDLGFRAIVDYAFEPVALKSLYKVVDLLNKNKVIHVCGSAGGGRDTSRRKPIGKIAGKNSDVVIVTNEDPYDEDPTKIIEEVSDGAKEVGKKLGKDLFEIENREDAIEKAINLADQGDLVLITGKGSEQGIVEKGEIIPWDDREIAKDKIKQITNE